MRRQDAPGTQTPDVIRMVGPVLLDQDLRSMPYIPAKTKRGRETSDALCAPQYGADKRPIRIRDFWPEVCPSIAQKSLAPSPDHAGATVYI